MEKIIKVLSLDMDFIMEPCIEIYNKYVHPNENKSWDIIMEKFKEELNDLPINEENLKIIQQLFDYNVKNSKVVFLKNHDAILYELTKPEYSDCKFNIVNVDHHHDICYSEENAKDLDIYDIVDESNWVWYLGKYNLINSYYWIKNKNSQDYLGPKLPFPYLITNDNKMVDAISEIEFDLVFVTLSPQWLPKKYEIYFREMIEKYDRATNKPVEMIDVPYSFRQESKPYIRL